VGALGDRARGAAVPAFCARDVQHRAVHFGFASGGTGPAAMNALVADTDRAGAGVAAVFAHLARPSIDCAVEIGHALTANGCPTADTHRGTGLSARARPGSADAAATLAGIAHPVRVVVATADVRDTTASGNGSDACHDHPSQHPGCLHAFVLWVVIPARGQHRSRKSSIEQLASARGMGALGKAADQTLSGCTRLGAAPQPLTGLKAQKEHLG